MSEEQEKKGLSVYKFTLGTGKVVYLREPDIGDTEIATKIAGKEAGPDNNAYLGILFQRELVKLLLVQIDNKRLSIIEKNQIKTLLNLKEYNQILKAVKQILGDDEGNFDLTPEHTTL